MSCVCLYVHRRGEREGGRGKAGRGKGRREGEGREGGREREGKEGGRGKGREGSLQPDAVNCTMCTQPYT